MTPAYDASHWIAFGSATAESAATLAGLLFVAAALNLERILAFPNLPARAGQTLIMFVSPLLVGLVVLIPGQTDTALSFELLVLAVVLATVQLLIDAKGGRSEFESSASWVATRLVPSVVPALCFAVGGATLLATRGGGLYWIVPGILVSVVAGLVNAWVLLIEIQR